MRLARTKHNLWHVMVFIAALTGLFAGFGVIVAAGILAAVSVASLPILLARPGRRLWAAAWVCSLYPLFILGSIYATWFTAWCVLGHQPRMSLDDPKYISPIVDIAFISTAVFMVGLPFALFLGVPMMLTHDVRCFRSEGLHPFRITARLVIPLLVWFSVFAILYLRLLGVGYIAEWYID
jgi:hypothetical protein